MNERTFKAKLRKLIQAKGCYIQSMSSYATNGTPDLWISGPKGDIWVEVKYDEKTKGPIKPKLSVLQSKWLHDRLREGRNVAVVVGTATSEAIIFRAGWSDKRALREPLDRVVDLLLEEVA
jgi:hypothetical protein